MKRQGALLIDGRCYECDKSIFNEIDHIKFVEELERIFDLELTTKFYFAGTNDEQRTQFQILLSQPPPIGPHYVVDLFTNGILTGENKAIYEGMDVAVGIKIVECAYGLNKENQADIIILVSSDVSLLKAVESAEGRKRHTVFVVPFSVQSVHVAFTRYLFVNRGNNCALYLEDLFKSCLRVNLGETSAKSSTRGISDREQLVEVSHETLIGVDMAEDTIGEEAQNAENSAVAVVPVVSSDGTVSPTLSEPELMSSGSINPPLHIFPVNMTQLRSRLEESQLKESLKNRLAAKKLLLASQQQGADQPSAPRVDVQTDDALVLSGSAGTQRGNSDDQYLDVTSPENQQQQRQLKIVHTVTSIKERQRVEFLTRQWQSQAVESSCNMGGVVDYDHYKRLRGLCLRVSSTAAGVAMDSSAFRGDLHGDYSLVGVMNKAGIFERRSPAAEDGKTRRFTIYRVRLTANSLFVWFLSVTPENCLPGSSQDVLLYYSVGKCKSAHCLVPDGHWGCMDSKRTGEDEIAVHGFRAKSFKSQKLRSSTALSDTLCSPQSTPLNLIDSSTDCVSGLSAPLATKTRAYSPVEHEEILQRERELLADAGGRIDEGGGDAENTEVGEETDVEFTGGQVAAAQHDKDILLESTQPQPQHHQSQVEEQTTGELLAGAEITTVMSTSPEASSLVQSVVEKCAVQEPSLAEQFVTRIAALFPNSPLTNALASAYIIRLMAMKLAAVTLCVDWVRAAGDVAGRSLEELRLKNKLNAKKLRAVPSVYHGAYSSSSLEFTCSTLLGVFSAMLGEEIDRFVGDTAAKMANLTADFGHSVGEASALELLQLFGWLVRQFNPHVTLASAGIEAATTAISGSVSSMPFSSDQKIETPAAPPVVADSPMSQPLLEQESHAVASSDASAAIVSLSVDGSDAPTPAVVPSDTTNMLPTPVETWCATQCRKMFPTASIPASHFCATTRQISTMCGVKVKCARSALKRMSGCVQTLWQLQSTMKLAPTSLVKSATPAISRCPTTSNVQERCVALLCSVFPLVSSAAVAKEIKKVLVSLKDCPSHTSVSVAEATVELYCDAIGAFVGDKLTTGHTTVVAAVDTLGTVSKMAERVVVDLTVECVGDDVFSAPPIASASSSGGSVKDARTPSQSSTERLRGRKRKQQAAQLSAATNMRDADLQSLQSESESVRATERARVPDDVSRAKLAAAELSVAGSLSEHPVSPQPGQQRSTEAVAAVPTIGANKKRKRGIDEAQHSHSAEVKDIPASAGVDTLLPNTSAVDLVSVRLATLCREAFPALSHHAVSSAHFLSLLKKLSAAHILTEPQVAAVGEVMWGVLKETLDLDRAAQSALRPVLPLETNARTDTESVRIEKLLRNVFRHTPTPDIKVAVRKIFERLAALPLLVLHNCTEVYYSTIKLFGKQMSLYTHHATVAMKSPSKNAAKIARSSGASVSSITSSGDSSDRSNNTNTGTHIDHFVV